ncbi:RagB/SusD family nutrient uptake outer membrane protein [Paludibacter sp.]|uniref:RagB/SusD family nutrient uptake outer membrane protein n=1 Tax=Paludibacter sp. TaxID=1898105 RepID=UPI001352C56E|nr:RagB/SusD family nutrient uptake outer membrane protein [Paludibacter sp.]MTK52700.1 RagB/SusD family nutrient uptake outer membrane protein [Paludibacter sp.]
MNKKIFLGILSFATLLLVGCSDKFLEEKKNYDLFDESIFENQLQAGWFVDRMYYDAYSGFKSPGLTVFGLYTEDRSRLTEEFGGYPASANLINSTLTYINASDCPTYFGSTLGSSAKNEPYTRIRYYNLYIQKIDEKGKNLSEDFKNKTKGQMYFLRALQYYDLLRVYGGVPIVTSVQDASSTNPATQLPRATTSEVVTQILSDLDKAASMLPATADPTSKSSTSWGVSDYGRLTGDAAIAMKSRVLLTYASPLYNKDWDNSGNQRWKDALAAGLAAETKLSADGYGLYNPNPNTGSTTNFATAKDWANMFVGFDNTFCKEAIMVQLLSNTTSPSAGFNNGWENSIRLKSQGGTGGVAAPKEMLDLFPMADGSRPTVANGYDDTKFFMNRDPRFYRTFAFSGCKWGYKANTSASVWLYRYLKADGKTKVYANSLDNTIQSPAYVSKMTNQSADNTGFTYSGTDIYEYRYAELLLNIAECYAATGDLTNCRTYLGKIRARVGIPQGTNYWGLGTFANKYQAIEACLYERRIELAYEGKRFWDAQRWMLYAGSSAVSSSENTCAKLGITPINGTCRTGNLWQAKTNTDTDPVPAATKTSLVIDPDAANFQTQLSTLSTVFDTYFKRVATDTPMDTYNGSAMNILFKPNYYVFGLPNAVLTNNGWLLQTKGWKDAYGADGTYDYQP